MKLAFLSPQTAAVARNDSLLDLLSELIDANADTVQLITGDQRTELERLAHCDYLRALQRLGRETLAHHDQRTPASPLTLVVVSGLSAALTQGRTAALLVLRGPARAAQALRPALSPGGERVLARVRLSMRAIDPSTTGSSGAPRPARLSR
jgi:hypothetical protein